MHDENSREYSVRWEIELYAETPAEAAMGARRILLDPDSEAVVFTARPSGSNEDWVEVDLMEVLDA